MAWGWGWFKKSAEHKEMIAAHEAVTASYGRLTEDRNAFASMEKNLAKLTPGSPEHTTQLVGRDAYKPHLDAVVKQHTAVEARFTKALEANPGGKAGALSAKYANLTNGGSLTGKAWGGAKDGAGKATGGVRAGFKWVAEKASYGMNRFGKFPLAVIGAGAAYWAYSAHKRAEQNSAAALDQQGLEATMPVNPNTLMGMQPVVGQHAQRVLAGRGGAQPGIDPSNPSLSGGDGVRNLGA